MKLLKRNWLIVAGVLVAVSLFAAFALNRKEHTSFFTARVDRGEIREVVQATGTIDAVTTVEVGSQVSGIIAELLADFNSQVRQGQVIARLDPSIFQGVLLQAEADLENAEANLAAARANLVRARATAVQTEAQYRRTQQLAQEGVMSQQQLEVAQAENESAQAAVAAAEAQVTQAAAQVSQRRAAVTVARTNLNHTVIRAPIDGIVVNRAVDVGQTVAASLQAPTLFTIAQDLTKMQVYTKTDEADVGRIRPGQRVTFRVDAFPGDAFDGHVKQVRMNPTLTQNVVTYDTVIEFANPEMKLFPGMTAYVTIPVNTAKDVLRVPNAALRYKPDISADETRELLARHGIEFAAPRQATAGAGAQRRPQGAGGQAQAPAGAPGQGNEAGAAAQQRRAAGPPSGERPGGGAVGERAGNSRVETHIVWKPGPQGSLVPVQIRTGITDRTTTELIAVVAGELREGDELVTGISTRARAASQGPPANPLGQQPRRR